MRNHGTSALSIAARSVAASDVPSQTDRESDELSAAIREEIIIALGLWIAGLVPLAILYFLMAG
jgi:hypothetical protein